MFIHCDNVTACTLINKGTCKDHTVMAALRRIFWYSAVYNFRLRAIYYPGHSNKLADCVSRLLRQGYRYHKLRKAFSKFYRRHFDIVSKYNVGLKTLLLQGLSEPEFYGDLMYKFRKIIGKNDFPYHLKKIIVRYKKIGYNINVMRQTACLVVNPIKVNTFAYLLNCTTVGRTSD